MGEKIRRSWLLVPMSKEERLAQAHQAGADVVVLDLVELVAERDKPAARERVQSALDTVRAGGAEVFAQVDVALPSFSRRAAPRPSPRETREALP